MYVLFTLSILEEKASIRVVRVGQQGHHHLLVFIKGVLQNLVIANVFILVLGVKLDLGHVHITLHFFSSS